MGTSLQIRMRRLYVEGFTAMDVAEPLVAFDHAQETASVRPIASLRRLSVVGVQSAGLVSGYARVEDLESEGTLGQYSLPFEDKQIVAEDTSFSSLIKILDGHDYCFLTLLGSVAAVVERGDLEKPPLRMWLFGMVTIAEMSMTRAIRELYPNDSWTSQLSAGRLEKARRLMEERARRNLPAILLDCLQFPDKAQILLRNEVAREDAGFRSVREGVESVKQFEALRNHLAHSQSIVATDWKAIVRLSGRVNHILSRL